MRLLDLTALFLVYFLPGLIVYDMSLQQATSGISNSSSLTYGYKPVLSKVAYTLSLLRISLLEVNNPDLESNSLLASSFNEFELLLLFWEF